MLIFLVKKISLLINKKGNFLKSFKYHNYFRFKCNKNFKKGYKYIFNLMIFYLLNAVSAKVIESAMNNNITILDSIFYKLRNNQLGGASGQNFRRVKDNKFKL